MNELSRCRGMESLCRQRATFYPEESWKWLAEAEMWSHKAFERSIQPAENKASTSKRPSVGEDVSVGRRLPSCGNVTEIRREMQPFEISEEKHRPLECENSAFATKVLAFQIFFERATVMIDLYGFSKLIQVRP